MSVEKLLTAKEVADILGVKTQTVREWLHRGKIPGTILPDGGMRFKPGMINMWIDSNTTKAKKIA